MLWIDSQPKVVGWWVLPGTGNGRPATRFAAFWRPNVAHRFFMRALMGWKWENE